CYIELLCRLCHTIQTSDGHCCIMAEGALDNSLIYLFASVTGNQLVTFKTSHYVTTAKMIQQFIKHKLTQAYIEAGIRSEKMLLLITEEDFQHTDLIIHVMNLLNSEEMTSLFSLEEETSVLNSVRTQVQQAGLTFSKQVAWEFFLRNVKDNIRVLILLNDTSERFQQLCLDYPALFNNISLIYLQHWDYKTLVKNAMYHLKELSWLDKADAENTAHLLASMHSSIHTHNEEQLPHVNNHTYSKFVEKFVLILSDKSLFVKQSHEDVTRLLEQIQYQHTTAAKLKSELEHEKMVLDERLKSTERMLVQIGQDMVMAEQQIRAHKSQTRRTVQLKRLLPEYQLTQEKNIYKMLATATDARKLMQNIDMNSLQELRSIQKPEQQLEDILASVIMILKSPTADVSWQKGAKRQMANIDRFLEETQSFEKLALTEESIKLIDSVIDRVQLSDNTDYSEKHYPSMVSLYKWVKRVLQYHSILLKKVRPLHNKCKEIEQDVLEQDQKLILLNKKSEALEARLKDLSQNFEEATVDKKDQEEKVLLKTNQLQTASQLNTILSREYERNIQIFESLKDRVHSLPASCAYAAGFLTYIGPYSYGFRRLMLTIHWAKCIRDRGLPVIFDEISSVKGRVINWQFDGGRKSVQGNMNGRSSSASRLLTDAQQQQQQQLPETGELIPGQSQVLTNITEEQTDDETAAVAAAPDEELAKQNQQETNENLMIEQNLNNDDNNNNEMADAEIPLSELSQIMNATEYQQFLFSLIKFIIGDDTFLKWLSEGVLSSQIENNTIIIKSTKYPALLLDPFSAATTWIQNYYKPETIDFDHGTNDAVMLIEQSFLNGTTLKITNCKSLDSILYPLAQWKTTLNEQNRKDDSNLIIYCGRRLYCSPNFSFLFQTDYSSLKSIDRSLTLLTTCCNYQYSVENLLDDLRTEVFHCIKPKLYQMKLNILKSVLIGEQRVKSIDELLKDKWKSDGFQANEVMITSVALERKYKLGEILDECYRLLDQIELEIDSLFPFAQHAAVLYSVIQRMNLLSPDYKFSLQLIYDLLDQYCGKISIDTKESPTSQTENDRDPDFPELPTLLDTSNLKYDNDMTTPVMDEKQIQEKIQKMIESFVKKLLPQISAKHRLHFLVLLQFFIKTASPSESSASNALELELLATGLPAIDTEALNFPSIKKPQWLDESKWFDLCSLTQLFSDQDLLGQLSRVIMTNEIESKQWEEWYDEPQTKTIPNLKINGEEKVLNEFEKLLLIRILRPDYYLLSLTDYVFKEFNLREMTIDIKLFNDEQKSCVIVNLPDMNVDASLNDKYDGYLTTKTHVNDVIEKFVQGKYKSVRVIDCPLLNIQTTAQKLPTSDNEKQQQYDMIMLKNFDTSSLSNKIVLTIFDDIRHNRLSYHVLITKKSFVELPIHISVNSLLFDYDSLLFTIEHRSSSTSLPSIELLNLTYYDRTQFIRHTLANIVQNSSPILSQCKKNQITILYGCILIQGILLSIQLFNRSNLANWIPWTNNFAQHILTILSSDQSGSDPKYSKPIIEQIFHTFITDPNDFSYVQHCLDELFQQQQQATTKLRLDNCEFSVPINDNQYTYEWFMNEHKQNQDFKLSKIRVNDYCTTEKQRLKQYEQFTLEFNQLWHFKMLNREELKINLVNFALQLLKERLPPQLNLKHISLENLDPLAIELYQVSLRVL
ncbi:unnamed protein product, partial [Didymodactylos carnosus]